MGTLAARIGQPLPHNDLLGPLDDVLARAAAPDVASRLDAAGLAARLGALAAALPTPSAAAPDHAEARGLRPDQRVPCARGVGADRLGHRVGRRCRGGRRRRGRHRRRDGDCARAGGGQHAHRDEGGPGRALRCRARQRRGVAEAVEAPAPWTDPEQAAAPPRRTRRARARSGGGSAERSCSRWWWPAGWSPRSRPTCSRRRIRRRRWSICRLAQARAAVDKVHMNLKEGAPVTSITVAAGDVVSQSPKAGVSQKEGSDGHGGALVREARRDGAVVVRYDLRPGGGRAAVGALPVSVCGRAPTATRCPPRSLVLWSINTTQNPTKAPYGSHHHARALAGPRARHRAEHPDELHVRPGAGRPAGRRPDGHAEQRVQHDRAVRTGDLDVAGQRCIGALRVGGGGQRLDGSSDDDRPQRHR